MPRAVREDRPGTGKRGGSAGEISNAFRRRHATFRNLPETTGGSGRKSRDSVKTEREAANGTVRAPGRESVAQVTLSCSELIMPVLAVCCRSQGRRAIAVTSGGSMEPLCVV